jgi:hypothetical protein
MIMIRINKYIKMVYINICWNIELPLTCTLVIKMGCDGGSIPRRAEMVKTKGKTEQFDDTEVTKQLWTCCFISKENLKRPVVACRLGRLYNKESVLMFLLNKTEADPALLAELSHVKSLKSVFTCNLTDSKDPESPYFVCPLTGRDMNGKSRFYAVLGCGCVLSEQAIREFPDSQTCLVCDRPNFKKESELVLLYPKAEELEQIRKMTIKEEGPVKIIKKKTESNQPSSKAQDLLEEMKANSSSVTFKRSKVTDSIYFNK